MGDVHGDRGGGAHRERVLHHNDVLQGADGGGDEAGAGVGVAGRGGWGALHQQTVASYQWARLGGADKGQAYERAHLRRYRRQRQRRGERQEQQHERARHFSALEGWRGAQEGPWRVRFEALGRVAGGKSLGQWGSVNKRLTQ